MTCRVSSVPNVERQIALDQADLQRVNEALEQFQAQYGLASDEFWRRFQAGQMPDTAEALILSGRDMDDKERKSYAR